MMNMDEHSTTLYWAVSASYDPIVSSLPDGYHLDTTFDSDGVLEDSKTDFRAIALTNDEGDYIIAFAGTEGLADAFADIQLGWFQWGENGRKIAEYIEEIRRDENDATFHFTGHSLGGALAQYAAYEHLSRFVDSPEQPEISLVTFNGLGGVEGLKQNADYSAEVFAGVDSVRHYFVEGDFVSQLGGGHVGGNTYRIDNLLSDAPLNFLDGHFMSTIEVMTPEGFGMAESAGIKYVNLPFLQPLAASIANLLNDDDVTELEGGARVIAGVAGAIELYLSQSSIPGSGVPSGELDSLAKILFTNLAEAENGTFLGDAFAAMAEVPWENISFSQIEELGAAGAVALMIGVMSDLYETTVDLASVLPGAEFAQEVNQAKEVLAEFIGTYATSYVELLAAKVGPLVNPIIEALHAEPEQPPVIISDLKLAEGGAGTLTLSLEEAAGATGEAYVVTVYDPELVQLGGEGVYVRDENAGEYLVIVGPEQKQTTVEVTAAVDGDEQDDFVFLSVTGTPFSELDEAIADEPIGFGTINVTDTHDAQGYNTILGDLLWQDFDSDRSGIQTRDDALGNKIYDGNNVEVAGQDDELYDSTANDHIQSKGGDDFINAFRGGDDHIETEDGQDIADGGAGDDLIEGGDGTDLLAGGDGNDQLYAEEKIGLAEFLNSDTGATATTRDWLAGGSGDDLLVGSHGENGLAGGGGDDVILGGAGDDNIFGDNDWFATEFDWNYVEINDQRIFKPVLGEKNPPDSGADIIYAGTGNDHVWAGAGDDVVMGGDGGDSLVGEDGNDTLLGEVGEDVLFGDAGYIDPAEHGNDYLDGGVGDDQLIGAGGNDMLYGGDNNDYLAGDSSELDGQHHGDDVLDGGSGNDTLIGGGGDDRLAGGDDNDILEGDSPELDGEYHGDDMLDGGEGNDQLFGSGGADTLSGGSGDDELYGDDTELDIAYQGDDTLDGGSGDDLLLGAGGNDTLYGGEDNDQLWGDAGDLDGADHGNDWLEGGSGEDKVVGMGGADILFGGSGEDTLFGDDSQTDPQYHGDDYLNGGEDADTLIGGGGNDALFGGAGDDYLNGDDSNLDVAYHGNDVLDGGEGNDTLFGSGGDDRLSGGTGQDVLAGGEGNDSLDGGEDADTLYGGDGADTLSGGAGNDTLYGNAGDDALFGGAGQDVLSGSAGNDSLDGGDGGDSLYGGDGHDTLAGGNGNDELYGNDGEDTLYGDVGNDILSGGAGNDSLEGGEGDDSLYGGDGTDIMQGGGGDDTLYGNAGDDALYGGDGDDFLHGGDGRNILVGGDGSDTLIGGTWDVLNGGEGDDRYVYYPGSGSITISDYGNNVLAFAGGIRRDMITVRLGSLMIDLGSGDEIHFEGFDPNDPVGTRPISHLEFSDGSSMSYDELLALGFDLDGTEGDDTLEGTPFEDRLSGYGGNDTLIGNESDDMLDGGSGADMMQGGQGDDTYRVDDAGDSVVEQADEGYDTVISSINHTLAENVEALELEGFALNGAGNAQDNTIAGNAGDNRLDGGTGEDRLEGLGGDDILLGGDGDDRLYGGAGNDRLDGGEGVDVMAGGMGADTYHVDDAADRIYEYGPQGSWQRGDDAVDTVIASVDYALPTYTITEDWLGEVLSEGGTVENLQLVGDSQSGTGNALDNTLTGNAGDNSLYGGAGNDVLDGMDGNDWLAGESGVDTLIGGLGDDTYVVSEQDDTLIEHAKEGTDTVISSVSYTLGSNLENLTLTGNAAINGSGNALGNVLTGNDASNILDGGVGADAMSGGAGNDTYVVESTDDSVIEHLYQGHDTVLSAISYTLGDNVENLTLTGDAALEGFGNDVNNVITGNAAANHLSGGAGNDTLDGGAGADAMHGGTGNDTYHVDDEGDVSVENSGEGHDRVFASASHTLGENLEDLYLQGAAGIGGTGNDSGNYIFGNDGNNYVDGRGGDDYLFGNGGEDVLDGGAGDDYLDGGNGADTMSGGTGNDGYRVDHWGDRVIEVDDGGIDSVTSRVGFTLGDFVENLYLSGEEGVNGVGNGLDNIIVGNDETNTLSGEGGDDTLDGAAGNDTLYGGDGVDWLYGGDDAYVDGYGGGEFFGGGEFSYGGSYLADNDDFLDGAAGDDHLDGGSGNDLLLGGDGNDYLYGGDDGFAVPPYGGGEYYGGGEFGYGGRNEGEPRNDDYLDGGAGNDVLVGGTGDDRLYGGEGEDVLEGGIGDDLLDGGAALDVMAGGNGNDVYYVDGYAETVTVPGSGSGGGDEGTGDEADGGDDGCVHPGHRSKKHHGNEGVGNGEDAPPPGHESNWNDGPGTSPGNPGKKRWPGKVIDWGYNRNPFGIFPWHQHGGWHGRKDGRGSHCGEVEPDTQSCEVGDFGLAAGKNPDSGPDTQILWHTDSVHEEEAGGYDIVYSSATFVLSDFVEELHLTGSEAIDGSGDAQANRLYGNAADNVLDGGEGSDFMAGGAGDDTYVVDDMGDIIEEWAAAGDDSVHSAIDYVLGSHLENLSLFGDGNLNGVGNALDNILTGNAGGNLLVGAAGNDTLDGGDGNDLLRGGAGDDRYRIGVVSGVDLIEDDEGMNTILFQEGLTADNVAARLEQTDQGTVVHLRLVDRHGNEMEDMGADFVLNEDGASPIAAFGFSDGSELTLDELLIEARTLAGSRRRDMITGDRHDETVFAGKGSDTVSGGAGHDTLYGESGNDHLDGGAGNDRLYGQVGRDDLAGGFGYDILDGGAGGDELSGDCHNDLLQGGEGDDLLRGGRGADVLVGGQGDDALHLAGNGDIVLFNKGDGEDRVSMDDAAERFTLSLGKGIALEDIHLARKRNDLVVELGNDGGRCAHHGRNREHDKVVMEDWYRSATHGDVVLQLVGNSDLVGPTIQQFDFTEIVELFDASRNDKWSITEAALEAHLGESDSEALGGDIAYRYATDGTLDLLGRDSIVASLSNQKLGLESQSVHGA